jgi:hypothetical protein
LLDKKKPTRGAVPAFFTPPQVGRLVIEAALRAALPAEYKTIVINYNNILFFY